MFFFNKQKRVIKVTTAAGFSLLETVVVVAIIAVLALLSINTVSNFQKEAALDSAAQEFAGTLRTAKNKSLAGEVSTGETVDDFTPAGLPSYGVEATDDDYFLVRKFVAATETDPTVQTLESFILGQDLTFQTDSTVFFKRITGEVETATTFVIEKSGVAVRSISADEDGLITIEKI